MNDIVASLAVVIVLLVPLRLVLRTFEPWERPWLTGALLAHVAAGLAQVFIVKGVYGRGDMLSYHRIGVMLAELVRESPVDNSWSLLQLVFQRQDIPLPVPVRPGATTSMMAIAGFVLAAVNDSLYAGCILIGGFAFFGKLALYRVFRAELPPATHRAVLLAALCVPSAVFWSSGILKEAVAVTGLGLAAYGGYVLATRRRLALGLLLLVAGVVLAALVKPYTLVPFAIAAGLWLYLDGARPEQRRRYRRVRVGGLVAGTVLAAGLVLGVGKAFPRFDPANFAEEAAHIQGLVGQTGGGSDYEIGGARETTLSGQLAFLPLALLNALFRPVVFEATNALMAANALEMLVVVGLWLAALVRTGPFRAARLIWGSPALAFCAVYTLGLAIGVGLGSTNMGSLSRYRVPLMPFYVVLLAVLSARRAQRAPTQASASPARLGAME
ncbi:MAG: hypothetical protein JW940_27125 [Polyangiaceae bacterium]|nr:hypothetical protein [Polyangiaceae bacterium]